MKTISSRTHTFVFVVFLMVGISFVATTAVLAWEFWDDGRWIDFAATDSHLFVFFPTFAIISLIAFYLPTCAVVDLYCNKLTGADETNAGGRSVLFFCVLILLGVSWLMAAWFLSGASKPIWDIKLETLLSDSATPADCQDGNTNCERVSILDAVTNLRKLGQSRESLRPFVRSCEKDDFIDSTQQLGSKRYCIATTAYQTPPKTLTSDVDCCNAQRRLRKAIEEIQKSDTLGDNPTTTSLVHLPLKIFNPEDPASNLSLTAAVHALFLPLKAFFFLLLLVVSILLALHFEKIAENYKNILGRIEVGLLVGTFAALFFPLMSQAFLVSVEVVLGQEGHGNFSSMIMPLSFLFGLWTLIILLYFFRRGDEPQIAMATKIAGVGGGILAWVNYQSLVDVLTWTVGAGAHWSWLLAISLFALITATILVRYLAQNLD